MLLRHQRSPPIIRKMIYPSDAPLPSMTDYDYLLHVPST